MFDLAVTEVGSVDVTTTNNKGHDPEFWANIATQQIVSVGGECHPVIKEQAEAFKLQVFNTVKYYMRRRRLKVTEPHLRRYSIKILQRRHG